MKDEGLFQTWLKKNLEHAGATVFNVHGHAMQSTGWPDLQIYHRMFVGHLELKAEDERPRDDQDRRLRKLLSCGVNAAWMEVRKDNTIRLWTLPARDEEWKMQVTPFIRRGIQQVGGGPMILSYLRTHVRGEVV